MGRADDLDVKGHVQGSGIEVKLGADSGTGLGMGQDTVVDSVVGDAEYSYDEGLAIANSTIRRGGAVLNVAGSLRPRKTVTRKGLADAVWDEGRASTRRCGWPMRRSRTCCRWLANSRRLR